MNRTAATDEFRYAKESHASTPPSGKWCSADGGDVCSIKTSGAMRFGMHSYEHVISYQKRMLAFKQMFMQRHKRTCRGWLEDFFERVEAQVRGALHSHILEWWKKRCFQQRPVAIDPVKTWSEEDGKYLTRAVRGAGQKQRPKTSEAVAVEPYQEDEVYYQHHAARVIAELVRPDVRSVEGGPLWGGYAFDKLVVAGFARAVQTRSYIHHCSPKYCLKHSSSCRFFFPWPKQVQQQYDENMERIAYRRLYPADDTYVISHDLDMAVFMTAIVHVTAWDPFRNVEFGKLYGTKCVAKPEPQYYIDSSGPADNPVRQFFLGRTVGLPLALNRLLGFHIVRSTRSAVFLGSGFLSPSIRAPDHVKNCPDYPDPVRYVGTNQWYFLRAKELRHLRVEQFVRYFSDPKTDQQADASRENTRDKEHKTAGHLASDPVSHRHYDEFASKLKPGASFRSRSSFSRAPVAKRRENLELACSTTYDFEPVGETREDFYQQRLLLALPWRSAGDGPEVQQQEGADPIVTWKLVSEPPESTKTAGGVQVPVEEVTVGESIENSWEMKCHELENMYSSQLGCRCCAGELAGARCGNCRHAVGFHKCVAEEGGGHIVWRRGTLFKGSLDAEGALMRSSKQGVNLDKLRAKVAEYIELGAITREHGKDVLKQIEADRGIVGEVCDGAEGGGAEAAGAMLQREPLTKQQLRRQLEDTLAEMERNMKVTKSDDGISDQWAVFSYIVTRIDAGEWVRLVVQADAGAGKSYVLKALSIWCLLRDLKSNACAPTGIAAANLEIEGVEVAASTLHKLFGLDFEAASKLNFQDPKDPAVEKLLGTQVLLGDEFSMVDDQFWAKFAAVLAEMPRPKRSAQKPPPDDLGPNHIILFLDVKQLPPATDRPIFLTQERVREKFRFMTLRENRRVVQAGAGREKELDNYHRVLMDISKGIVSDPVKRFLVQKYGEGGLATANKEPLEGSTCVFAKRRYRDKWNNRLVQKLKKQTGHTLSVRAKCRPHYRSGTADL